MRYWCFLLLVSFVSCNPEPTAQEVIDNAIENSGLRILKNASISFKFRGKTYKALRDQGNFQLERITKSDSAEIKDVLSNKGFKRFINDSLINLSKKDENRYSNSVNSVHYFSILPLGLNDAAVQKKLLPRVTIKGKEYYKVQVSFTEEGGGDDFDDVFIYWFAIDDFALDYMAYKYQTNGGGVRFRDVKKEHLISNVRLVDYNNYKPKEKNIDFFKIDELYQAGELLKLSEIILEDITIN